MLGLRNTTDCQPRSKNGQPAHRTTGVASANSIQPSRRSRKQVLKWMAGQNIRDHDGEQRQRERDPNPEAPGHGDRVRDSLVVGSDGTSAQAPCRRWDKCPARRAQFPDAWGRCTRSAMQGPRWSLALAPCHILDSYPDRRCEPQGAWGKCGRSWGFLLQGLAWRRVESAVRGASAAGTLPGRPEIL